MIPRRYALIVGALRPGKWPDESVAATLIEISNRSCRLITAWKPETGDEFELTLPKATTASRALTVGGHVVRVGDGPGRDSHTLTLRFDRPMSAQIRTELSGVVKLWSVGPPVSSTGGAESALKKPPHAYPVPVEVDRDKAPSVRVQVEILDSRGPK